MMKPDPTPCAGVSRGIWNSNFLKNWKKGSFSSKGEGSCAPVLIMLSVLMLTTEGPTRAASALKSGSVAVAMDGATAFAGGGVESAAMPLELHPAISAGKSAVKRVRRRDSCSMFGSFSQARSSRGAGLKHDSRAARVSQD